MRAAHFPVFCRALAIWGATKKRRGILRQAVSCGSVLVFPGDIVVADDSGIVVIAPDEVEQVLDRARVRQNRESEMMKALQAGRSTQDLLGLNSALENLGFRRAAGGGSAE